MFNRASDKTIVEADVLLELLIISVNQSRELYYFKALDLYYLNAANR
jgi:hypothetical protein